MTQLLLTAVYFHTVATSAAGLLADFRRESTVILPHCTCIAIGRWASYDSACFLL